MIQLNDDDKDTIKNISRENGINYIFLYQIILDIRKVGFFEISSEKSVNFLDILKKKYGILHKVKYIKYENWHRIETKSRDGETNLYEIFIGKTEKIIDKIYNIYPNKEKRSYLEEAYYKFFRLIFKKDLKPKNLARKHGKLFGYPSCCIESFWPNYLNTTPEFIFNSYLRTKSKRFNKFLNIIWEGQKYISHIPCTFDCAESIKFAKKITPYENASELVGDFFYFNNGTTIKLKSSVRNNDEIFYNNIAIKKTSDNISKEIKLIAKILKKGNRIIIGETVKIYSGEKIIYNLGGKNKYWIFMSFI